MSWPQSLVKQFQNPLSWPKIEDLLNSLEVHALHRVRPAKIINERTRAHFSAPYFVPTVIFTILLMPVPHLPCVGKEIEGAVSFFSKFPHLSLCAVEVNGPMFSNKHLCKSSWQLQPQWAQTPARDESFMYSLTCLELQILSTVEKFILEKFILANAFVRMIGSAPPQYSILLCLWQQQGQLGKAVFNMVLAKACQIISFPTQSSLPQHTSHRKATSFGGPWVN